MLGRSAGLLAASALGAAGLLIPTLGAPDARFSDYGLSAASPKTWAVRVPCSSCVFAPVQETIEETESEDAIFRAQGGDHSIVLNFTISEDDAKLELNGEVIFPIRAGPAVFDAPRMYADQVATAASWEDISAGEASNTPVEITGSGAAISQLSALPDGDTLTEIRYVVFGLEGIPMELSAVVINLVRTDSGELLILTVEVDPSEGESHGPGPHGRLGKWAGHQHDGEDALLPFRPPPHAHHSDMEESGHPPHDKPFMHHGQDLEAEDFDFQDHPYEHHERQKHHHDVDEELDLDHHRKHHDGDDVEDDGFRPWHKYHEDDEHDEHSDRPHRPHESDGDDEHDEHSDRPHRPHESDGDDEHFGRPHRHHDDDDDEEDDFGSHRPHNPEEEVEGEGEVVHTDEHPDSPRPHEHHNADAKGPRPHHPHGMSASKGCGILPGPLCRLKNMISSKIHGQKTGGCPGRKGAHPKGRPHEDMRPSHVKPHAFRPDMDDEHIEAEDGPPHRVRPHGVHAHHHQGPHGHHHRFGFMHAFARGVAAVLIPTMAGVAVGMSVSLVGLAVGRLISFLWIKFARGGRRGYASVALDESSTAALELPYEQQEKEALPAYEDVPACVDEKKQVE